MQTTELTKREIEIAGLIAYGHIDKEAADRLHISRETVRTHRKNIYTKTGCRNTADLTRYFFSTMFNLNFEHMKKALTFLAAITALFLGSLFYARHIGMQPAQVAAKIEPAQAELLMVYLITAAVVCLSIYLIKRIKRESEI